MRFCYLGYSTLQLCSEFTPLDSFGSALFPYIGFNISELKDCGYQMWYCKDAFSQTIYFNN